MIDSWIKKISATAGEKMLKIKFVKGSIDTIKELG